MLESELTNALQIERCPTHRSQMLIQIIKFTIFS